MNRRLVTILLCALVISAGASYVVYRLIGHELSAKARPQTTQVLVAAHTLEIGSLIRDTDVRMGEWLGPLPKGIVTVPQTAIGRGIVSSVYEGEPIMENRLAPIGSGGGLAATIPAGMRACAVRVNEVVGVAGFVVPGMRVDVLISGTPPGASAPTGPKVKTLLQNIQVLSAGTNIQKDNEGKPVQVPVVNLLVTPEQAEVLSLASNETRIQLVLRNPLDTVTAKTAGTGMSALFADGNAPAARKTEHVKKAAPKPPAPVLVADKTPVVHGVYLIEVLNGSKRSEAKFDRDEEQK